MNKPVDSTKITTNNSRTLDSVHGTVGALKTSPQVPARILNEFVYCPRLAYLMWVQKEWAHSAETVDGRRVHRRVDAGGGKLQEPDAEMDELKRTTRSVELSSERLGLIAKIDLVESENGEVRPVDYKRGKRPHVAKAAYDPERVQLCAQGLLLREHGYRCDEGILYFAASRERVKVAFDEELKALTLDSLHGLKSAVKNNKIPPPLVDSPKCHGCSLAGICLPDEVNLLTKGKSEVRPISVMRSTAVPLYVQAHHAKVAKEGDRLAVYINDDLASHVRIREVSRLVVMGNAYVTTPTLHALMQKDIPITWMSYGGWLSGHTIGVGHNNVELRTAQYKASFDEDKCLALARGWIRSKIRNSRTLLRRNLRNDDPKTLKDLKWFAEQAVRSQDISSLLGIEGVAARCYFEAFAGMFRTNEKDQITFDLEGRNRRPPRDPVNAMLSFGYALLTRECLSTLSAVGFDAYRGFYHQPRFGRPSLALDFMEPFRPLIADSVVIRAINNGEIQAKDFIVTPVGTNMTDIGRKKFIAAFERRMADEVQHPLFGYSLEYRRLIELQCRLLARHLLGEIDEYPNFVTR